MSEEVLNNGAFGWDDEIVSDGNEFRIVPEGVYPFTVIKYERKLFQGSAKLPPCKELFVTIRIDSPDGPLGTISKSLYLHDKVIGILTAFFRSIGQKQHGQGFKIQWDKIVGSTGRCRVKIRQFTKRDGSKSDTNEVDFLDPLPDATGFDPNQPGW